jgi:hypothetical protein
MQQPWYKKKGGGTQQQHQKKKKKKEEDSLGLSPSYDRPKKFQENQFLLEKIHIHFHK